VLCGLELGALRVLELSKNAVGDGGAEALASCAALRELEELALFDAQLGDAGALALVKAAGTTLPKLWKINLLGNKLSPMALGELDAIAAERELSLKLP
jgi:Ran GTPase-activating protein (RanGAP) involved in mRNA processing and transport